MHATTLSKYYGCGLCLPEYDMTGMAVLDLGCGAGRDVYVAAQLVGSTGRVVGVDMTKAQLDAARAVQPYHAAQFGYDNVAFVEGYLEGLDAIPSLQASATFDLIVSNCVLNLCTDKLAVLQSCHRLLKPGGEFYFSDVYASRRVPEALRRGDDGAMLWGECLAGALYWNDFTHLAAAAGFGDARLVTDAPITIANATVRQLVRDAVGGGRDLQFFSATYRLWKLDDAALDADCEDYGQAVAYRGSLPRAPSAYTLDRGHVFDTGRVVAVCGNTYRMLREAAALAPHFDFYGDGTTHYGLFDCGGSGGNGGKRMPFGRGGGSTPAPASSSSSGNTGAGCC